MKKKALAILICLVMTLTLGASPVLADDTSTEKVWVGGTDVSGGGYWLNTTTPGGIRVEGAGVNNYNVHYDPGTGILTLKGANITENHTWTDEGDNYSAAVYSTGSLELKLVGNNKLSGAGSDETTYAGSYGICVDDSLTISGEGSVEATGGAADDESYGVSSYNDISITGGSVKATGDAAYYSSGVDSYGGITISGGSVTATGGAADYSCGVYGDESVTISGGSVTATGGTAGDESYGVSSGDITITGGSVTATGSTAYYSSGVDSYDGDVLISGGSVTATGGAVSGEDSYSCGVYGDEGVTISGGSITAIGGAAGDKDSESYGVSSHDDIMITGGSVTATGGTAYYSSGVDSIGGITISGGNVEATGGAANYSCGVYGYGGVTISGGRVKAVGETEALNKLTIEGDPPIERIVTVSEHTSGLPAVAYNPDDLSKYKYFRIAACVWVGGTDVSGGGYWVNNTTTGGITTTAGAINYNVHYDPATGILTLNEADITKNYLWEDEKYNYTAAVCSESSLEIKLIGDNRLSGADSTGVYSDSRSFGVYIDNSLTISGEGSLEATGGTANGSIGVRGHSITMSGGTLKATGGATSGENSHSYGVSCQNYVTISGGSVTAKGGSASNNNGASYGVCGRSVEISGGSVTAEGGAAYSSYGVYGDNVMISGNNVTAIGGSASGNKSNSYGVYGDNVMISGNNVTAIGGTANNGSFAVFGNSSVTISGGSVTATGGTASSGSMGVFGKSSVTISGGSVNATGGTAYLSCGVCSDSSVTISGGSVNATGGTAYLSCGVFGSESVTISGGTMKAVGNTVALAQLTISSSYQERSIKVSEHVSGAPTTPYSAENLSNYKFFHITPMEFVPTGKKTGTPAITLPASSDGGSVKVNATVSGNKANITVTDAQLAQIVSDDKPTGTVKVDASALKVDAAVIPARLVDAAAGASGSQGLEVILPTGSVTLDNTALASIGNEDITVSVAQVKSEELSEAQRQILGNQADTALVVDVNVLVNDVKTSSFNGGTISVGIPYVAKDGEDVSKLVVWYLADDGSIEPMNGSYNPVTQRYEFTTAHLSAYVLTSFPFTDIPADSYCYSAVAWAIANDVTQGTSAATFSPAAICTRAQTVTFLWRAMGSPEPTSTSCPFTDVSADDYYYKAVLWAVEKGITKGTGATTFSPDATVSRGEAVTFQWRAAAAGAVSAANPFTDVAADAYYADAVLWAVSENITQGTGPASFSPADPCTRDQIVTFLYRLSLSGPVSA